MLPQRTGLSLQSPLRPISVLVFHLLLTHSCRGQSQMIGPLQPIVALVGDDVILPCHLEPAVDVSAMTLEWTRPDLKSIAVFVWRAGKDLVHVKDPSYTGRTSLFTDGLKHRNISLKLSKVKPSDEGRYKCYVPDLSKGSLVELVVGSVSSPVITLAGIDEATGGVMLACRSEGWYPEPEVLWLDGEGNLLSAGPPETVRGPDDLYTVSSRVTVEKTHSNSFTCRVQQKNTNQTRETHIWVPDNFFNVQSSSVHVITGLAVSLAVCILLLLFVVWKWRLNRIKTKRSCRDQTEKGEKKKHSKTNKSEDQCVTEERERKQLMTDGVTVEMEALKGNVQKKSKHLETIINTPSRSIIYSLLERSRAAPVRSSSSGFKRPIVSRQKLQEEQQRRHEAENRVQVLEEELQTKNRELEDKQQAAEAQMKKTNEELKEAERQLKNKNEEISQLNRELEDKQAVNTQWKKTNEELKEAERQLKNKNEEISQLKREFDKLLWDHQQKKGEAERDLEQLKTKNTELEDKQQAAEIQMKKTDEELKEAERQLKNKNEEISQLNREWQQKFYDETTKKEEAEKEVENLKKEVETKVNASGYEARQEDSSQSFHQDKSSSAGQSSTTEPFIVVEVNQKDKYIRLINKSNQDQPLGGWRLETEVNRKIITYTFEKSFKLKSRSTNSMSGHGGGSRFQPTELSLKDFTSWSSGDYLKFTLISDTDGRHQLGSYSMSSY